MLILTGGNWESHFKKKNTHTDVDIMMCIVMPVLSQNCLKKIGSKKGKLSFVTESHNQCIYMTLKKTELLG